MTTVNTELSLADVLRDRCEALSVQIAGYERQSITAVQEIGHNEDRLRSMRDKQLLAVIEEMVGDTPMTGAEKAHKPRYSNEESRRLELQRRLKKDPLYIELTGRIQDQRDVEAFRRVAIDETRRDYEIAVIAYRAFTK